MKKLCFPPWEPLECSKQHEMAKQHKQAWKFIFPSSITSLLQVQNKRFSTITTLRSWCMDKNGDRISLRVMYCVHHSKDPTILFSYSLTLSKYAPFHALLRKQCTTSLTPTHMHCFRLLTLTYARGYPQFIHRWVPDDAEEVHHNEWNMQMVEGWKHCSL